VAVHARDFTRPLRVALAGGGRMALHHARAIARSGGLAQLVAVADPVPASLASVRQASLGVREFPSLEELLATVAVDVVHVCTPANTHATLARAALGAGCHVYVEKPFAESTVAAEQVLSLASRQGLQVCPGHQCLFERPAVRAQALLPYLGDVVHVESFFAFTPAGPRPTGTAPLAPHHQLLDILPHPVYLLEHFLRQGDARSPIDLIAIEVGPQGTVHALVRCGRLTGTLVVTLEGRPVQHYLRLVGSHGMAQCDFVVGTVQRLLGPGTSGIDKVLAPFRLARQLVGEATSTLSTRVIPRQRSYPGLTEITAAFYRAIQSGSAPPVSPDSILATQRICDQIAAVILPTTGTAAPVRPVPPTIATGGSAVAVTGATGLLGSEVVRELTHAGTAVRAVVRREPAPWEQIPGVEYVVADLGAPLATGALRGCRVVVHCAAETRGSWDAHQRNSIDATRHLLSAAAAARVRAIVHVSSLGVLADGASQRKAAPDESTPPAPNSQDRGPYVWGKLESERLALRLGEELGLQVKVVRPGAIIDSRHFDPPGRLGRRVGPVFVAVGSPRDQLAVVERSLAARTLAWLALHFDEAPETLHLVAPQPPTKRDLVTLLRRTNPDLTVVWLPRALLLPLAWLSIALQKVLHPRRPAMNPARAFAPQPVDTTRIQALAPLVLTQSPRRSAAASSPTGAVTGAGEDPRPRPRGHQGSSLARRISGE